MISMVVDGCAGREPSCWADGAAHAAPAGPLIADMSTIAPGAALAIGAELERLGHR